MMTLWTLLAAVVRLWAWTCHRSAAAWADYHTAAAKAATTAAAGKVKDLAEQLKRDRKALRFLDEAERAEAKADRKAALADRLTRWHGWLSRPRTLAGGVAGAATVPGVLVGLTVGGVDVPELLRLAAGWVRVTVGM